MSKNTEDTIFAIATGAGKSAIAVVRVSGPSCFAILKKICPGKVFLERVATFASIVDLENEIIDTGIVLYFSAPRSFTGEDVIEFQVTGSRAVLTALLQALEQFPRTRPAEAGEFSRRSFYNGKRDLAQVEGLSAVVDAETRMQLRHGQHAATGVLSRECDAIKGKILDGMIITETLLDFSDVEDINNPQLSSLFTLIRELRERTGLLLRNSAAFNILREGFTIVIAGPPNVGKSSLINWLTKRNVSIVSTFPGTTRDVIEAFVDIDGFPVVFVDTAGVREPRDPIEAEGIARAIERRKSADLTLLLSTCTQEDVAEEGDKEQFITVKTKCDMSPEFVVSSHQVKISVITGEGLEVLVKRIVAIVRDRCGNSLAPLLTTQRQRAAILDADEALNRLLSNQSAPIEILAEEMRIAARCMGRVVGRIDVEDVLGGIFARLCVGK